MSLLRFSAKRSPVSARILDASLVYLGMLTQENGTLLPGVPLYPLVSDTLESLLQSLDDLHRKPARGLPSPSVSASSDFVLESSLDAILSLCRLLPRLPPDTDQQKVQEMVADLFGNDMERLFGEEFTPSTIAKSDPRDEHFLQILESMKFLINHPALNCRMKVLEIVGLSIDFLGPKEVARRMLSQLWVPLCRRLKSESERPVQRAVLELMEGLLDRQGEFLAQRLHSDVLPFVLRIISTEQQNAVSQSDKSERSSRGSSTARRHAQQMLILSLRFMKRTVDLSLLQTSTTRSVADLCLPCLQSFHSVKVTEEAKQLLFSLATQEKDAVWKLCASTLPDSDPLWKAWDDSFRILQDLPATLRPKTLPKPPSSDRFGQASLSLGRNGDFVTSFLRS